MRFAGLILFTTLAACSMSIGDDHDKGVQPSGSGTTRSYPISGFSKIDLSGADDVQVSVGGAFSVMATGPASELDRLRIVKDGDALGIGRKHGSFSWGDHQKVTVRVTLPALSEANISGSGDMNVDKVTGHSFTGQAAGSGDLALGQMAVDAASFSIAGSGRVKAAGAAKSLDVDIAGSGELDAKPLVVSQAKVNIAGSGNATATVDGPAQVSILGSGDADLGPKARCQVSKVGSGDARCGG